MSGIEPVFWRSFRRLGRACLRRYLASTLVYFLVLGSWSYAINRLLDGVLGTSSSWWWIVGLSCLLWLWVRVRRVGAFSAEWVEHCSRKLFSHDELGNALDFLKRPRRSTFMKAHLIHTGRVLARMRVPWFYFFNKRHLLFLCSLSLVWVPSAWWASTATGTQLAMAVQPQADSQFQPQPQSVDQESPSDRTANKPAASDDQSEPSRQDQVQAGSSPRSEDEIAEGEPPASESGGQPESKQSSGPPNQNSALSARSGLSSQGESNQGRDDPESGQVHQASTANRSEPQIDQFLLTRNTYSERLSPGNEMSRRIRTGLNVSTPEEGRQGPDADEPVEGGASGAVGSTEGSKRLAAPTDIRASFYEAPIQGIAGDGPTEVRMDTLSDRESRSSSWRGNLKNTGSAFRKKQALPDFYQALVEKYFRSTRARQPDQSH